MNLFEKIIIVFLCSILFISVLTALFSDSPSSEKDSSSSSTANVPTPETSAESEPEVFDASEYNFIDAGRLLEFGAYMAGEKVITEIPVAAVEKDMVKSNLTDDGSFTYDIVCNFDKEVEGVSEGTSVIVAGSVQEPSSIVKTISLDNCRLVPDGSYNMKSEPEAQQTYCETLKQTILDEEAAALEKEKSEYIAECVDVSYSDVSRNPGNYEGKKVVISGTVIQVQEGFFDTVSMRVQTAYGIWYVSYARSEGESRILENDYITCYGECKGVETYIAVLGNTVTIPSMSMKYYN